MQPFSPTPLRSRLIHLLGLFALVLLPANGQEERAADHEELIALRTRFTEALNERDFEKLKPLVHEDLTFISISNEKIKGLEELKDYWDKLFTGDQAILESITVNPVADERTTFLGDEVGVAQGTSRDTFGFRILGERELTNRWTAVVVREGGQWKVSRVHMSANVLDNPVLQATKKSSGLIGAVIGLVVGAILVILVSRLRSRWRSKSTPEPLSP